MNNPVSEIASKKEKEKNDYENVVMYIEEMTSVFV